MTKRVGGIFNFALAFIIALFSTTVYARSESKQSKLPIGSKSSNVVETYKQLLKPLDIYAVPPKATKLLTLKEMYKLVQSKGANLKVSTETFNTAKELEKKSSERVLPVASLDLSHEQKWQKTLVDSDTTDSFADRDKVIGMRNITGAGGFSVNGTPFDGLTYKLAFPQLTHNSVIPDPEGNNPPRPDLAAFSASLGVALLKDNPFFKENLTRRKNDLNLLVARETLRADTLRYLLEAESNFFGLIQKFLQLTIQDHSLQLARALKAEVLEKINAGESSSLEATRAELQEAQAEVEFMSSQIEYEASLEDFRSSLAYGDAEGVGVFPDPSALKIDVDSLKIPIDVAANIKRNNPEIGQTRLGQQISEVELEIARLNTLPSLAFGINYGNSVPGDGLSKTSWNSLRPNDRTFSASITYSQILYNNQARSELRQAAVSRQKSIYTEESVVRRIEKELNALLKKIEIGRKRYQIAKVSREIAEKKLNSEYEKFRAGESSVRNVIDTQTEVNGARIVEIGARIEMFIAFSQLRTLKGELPDGLEMKY